MSPILHVFGDETSLLDFISYQSNVLFFPLCVQYVIREYVIQAYIHTSLLPPPPVIFPVRFIFKNMANVS